MQHINIRKVCNIEIGKTPSRNNSSYWGEGKKWVSIRDMKEKLIVDTNEEITEEAIKETSIKLVPKNTVIMSFKLSVGKVAITGEDLFTNEAIAAFHILDKNVLCYKYLYYVLQTLKLTDNTDRAVMGLTLNKQKLNQISIPLPPLETQKQIVEALDKAQALIDARKEQIRLMDELVKSRFVEMFGNPILNNKNFEIKLGENVYKLSNGKTVPTEKRNNSGIPAYGGNGISWYTDEVLFDEDTVVVGRVGFQSGNVHLVKGPLWITDNAMYISKLFDDEYKLEFLYALMEHIDFSRFQDAGDLKKVTQKPFMEMNYIKPPIVFQEEYLHFSEQVDKLKLDVQKNLDYLSNLYNSIQQSYFDYHVKIGSEKRGTICDY